MNVNGVNPSGVTPFDINAPLNVENNSALSLIPNASPVEMFINSSLTQTGGTVTLNRGSSILVEPSGSYALNGGTLQLGGNTTLTNLGIFSLRGGTIEVIGSDLVLNTNMSFSGNTVSFFNLNGFNAKLSGNLS
jgi:hypothetical protein